MLDKKSESEIERLADLDWTVLIPKVEESLETIRNNNFQLGEEVKKMEKQIGFIKQIAKEHSKEYKNFEKTILYKEMQNFLEKLEDKARKFHRMKEDGEGASIILLALLSKVKREMKNKDHMDKFKAD